MSRTKLTPVMRSTILHAAAYEALHHVCDTQQRDGAQAAGEALCTQADDLDGAEAARSRAEGAHAHKIARLEALVEAHRVEEPHHRGSRASRRAGCGSLVGA